MPPHKDTERQTPANPNFIRTKLQKATRFSFTVPHINISEQALKFSKFTFFFFFKERKCRFYRAIKNTGTSWKPGSARTSLLLRMLLAEPRWMMHCALWLCMFTVVGQTPRPRSIISNDKPIKRQDTTTPEDGPKSHRKVSMGQAGRRPGTSQLQCWCGLCFHHF